MRKTGEHRGKTQIHIIPGLQDGSVGHALATQSLSTISRTHTKVKKERVCCRDLRAAGGAAQALL